MGLVKNPTMIKLDVRRPIRDIRMVMRERREKKMFIPKKNKKKDSPYAKITRVSWDTMFYDDIANHEGFVITEPAMIRLDGKITKTLYGPNSPLFGTTYGDEQAFMERHRCKCGAFKGKQWEGEVCPFCHEKVEAREVDIKLTGWMSLGRGNHIIHPYWYQLFSTKLIGKKVFPDIINRVRRVDINGNEHELIPGVDYEPLSPFSAIGIDEFYERYDEILDYFAKKRKDRAGDFEKAKREKYKVFVSHIPVYSTMMRPSSATADTFYYNTIDKHINPLFNLTESIKDCEPIEKEQLLQSIQYHTNEIWKYNFDCINKKEGFIRNKLIAGSLNWTSRCVITPDPTLRVDEITLSYQCFRIIFKYRIIYYIMKIENIPLAKAYHKWVKAYRFDKQIYDIMSYIISAESPRVLLNRNPTLNVYSMLLLRVRDIVPSDTDLTLHVPLTILPGLNADFDGDVLNLIAIIGDEMVRMFRNFDPIEKYIISRTTKGLDNKFAVNKGQKIDLYYFMTFKDKAPVEPINDPDELLPLVEKMKKEHEERLHVKRLQKDRRVKRSFPKVTRNYDKIEWW